MISDRIGMSQKQARLGITGGIASGKTTVTGYLETHYGYPIFDADVYAREAVEPGSEIFERIVQRYGQGIQLQEGSLDRQRLGEIIFDHQEEREWLEQQIHPYVRDRFQTILDQSSPQDTLIFSIPLLFEAQMTDLVQNIWVVWCTPKQQLQRLQQRNSLTLPQAQARLNSQLPLLEKCQKGDRILDNSSTPAALFAQIDNILKSERIIL